MMQVLASGVLLLAAGLLAALTLAFFIQAVAILTRRDKATPLDGPRPACAVIVPAHNEEAGIAATVQRLLAELSPEDRLVVVADNCSDGTAALAADAGAEVLVRDDAVLKGKGHALSAGLRHLASSSGGLSPAVVAFVDADCRFAPGGLERLARACAAFDAPVQCRNLMVGDPDQAQQSRLREFAWRVRNDFRPTGYARLGLPCQLFGTGMAMPLRLASPERFATGHVAEDLLIGVEAALRGHPPRYVRDASLFSNFPDTETGVQQQKKRWVHGHLSVIASHAPRLLRLGLRRRDVGLLAMAGDLMIPPMTLLAGAHVGLTLAAMVLGLWTGAWAAFAAAAAGFAMFAFSLAAAWSFCGRELIGWRELRQVPGHAARVAGTAFGFARGKRSGWVRADRTRSH